MEDKDLFQFSDYEFKKIKLPFYYIGRNNNGEPMEVEGEWTLMVDNFCRIHGFTTRFTKLYITLDMQGLNWDDSCTSQPFKFWFELVKLLGFEPSKRERNQMSSKRRVKLDNEQIEIVNKYFSLHQREAIETFRNVEFATFAATNPSGSAGIRTKIDGKEYVLSQFLQIFNISYQIYFDLYFKEQMPEETFENWIKSSRIMIPGRRNSCDTIYAWLKDLNSVQSPDSRKTLLMKWRELVNKQNSEINKIQVDALRERQNLAKNIDDKYSSMSKFAMTFWGLKELVNDYERAHIKSVSSIIKESIHLEYGSENYLKKISEISDINNCLPLSPNMHTAFDHNRLFWDSKGILIKKSEGLPPEVESFSKIPSPSLTKELIKYINASQRG